MFFFCSDMRTASSPRTAPPDPADVRTGELAAMLRELSEIGMDLARSLREAVRDQVEAARAAGEPAPAVTSEAGLTFSRIARGVRLTVALERALYEPPKGAGSAKDRDMAAQIAGAAQRLRRKLWVVAGGHEVKTWVEKTIETQATGEREAERLKAELNEKLADEDEIRPLLGLPVGEMIARVCRDLGLEPNEQLWAHEPWAIEEAAERAAAGTRPPAHGAANDAGADAEMPRPSRVEHGPP